MICKEYKASAPIKLTKRFHDYEKEYSEQDILKSFTSGESGFTRCSADGSKRFTYCQTADINNWVLMTIVSQEIIAQAERQNIYLAIIMAFQLSGILILFFIYIYFMQRKAQKILTLNDKCFRALNKPAKLFSNGILRQATSLL